VRGLVAKPLYNLIGHGTDYNFVRRAVVGKIVAIIEKRSRGGTIVYHKAMVHDPELDRAFVSGPHEHLRRTLTAAVFGLDVGLIEDAAAHLLKNSALVHATEDYTTKGRLHCATIYADAFPNCCP